MNERPILFSGPLVRAILSGRKTVTRRLVKGIRPEWVWVDWHGEDDQPGLANSVGGFIEDAHDLWPCNREHRIRCPHGKPGDELWVRESYWHLQHWAGGQEWLWEGWSSIAGDENPKPVVYGGCNPETDFVSQHRWRRRPSIHMPRWASRISLRITDVRAERLQEITGADVLAEGVDNGYANASMGQRWDNAQRMAFEKLWDDINGKRPGASWADNPWVWRIEFGRVKQ